MFFTSYIQAFCFKGSDFPSKINETELKAVEMRLFWQTFCVKVLLTRKQTCSCIFKTCHVWCECDIFSQCVNLSLYIFAKMSTIILQFTFFKRKLTCYQIQLNLFLTKTYPSPFILHLNSGYRYLLLWLKMTRGHGGCNYFICRMQNAECRTRSSSSGKRMSRIFL